MRPANSSPESDAKVTGDGPAREIEGRIVGRKVAAGYSVVWIVNTPVSIVTALVVPKKPDGKP